MYTIEQRVYIVQLYATFRSPRKVQIEFHKAYPCAGESSAPTIRKFYSRFSATGSVRTEKRKCPNRVLTDSKVTEIVQSVAEWRRKSINRRLLELGISAGSLYAAIKRLKMHGYKPSTVQALKPLDKSARVQFCAWAIKRLSDRPETEILFSEEAWFTLSQAGNRQNYRYWSAENPNRSIEIPLHDQKMGA